MDIYRLQSPVYETGYHTARCHTPVNSNLDIHGRQNLDFTWPNTDLLICIHFMHLAQQTHKNETFRISRIKEMVIAMRKHKFAHSYSVKQWMCLATRTMLQPVGVWKIMTLLLAPQQRRKRNACGTYLYTLRWALYQMNRQVEACCSKVILFQNKERPSSRKLQH
jgi:hypothetical protein